MTQRPIDLPTVDCERCGYQWPPRVPRPKKCPACKSPYWHTPRGQLPTGAAAHRKRKGQPLNNQTEK